MSRAFPFDLAAGLVVAGILAATPARTQPAASAAASAAAALPATPEEIAANWGATSWKPVSPPGYFFSGFKNETEYADPKLHIPPPNPPPLTPEWQARYDQIRQAAMDGENLHDNGNDCTPWGVPFVVGLSTFELLFTPGRLTVIYDGQGGVRRIWLDGRRHPGEIPEPQYNGYSVAHWEGRTLVIDTIGLRDDRFIEPGLRHSDQLRVIERWTQVSQDLIENEVTMIDPVAMTRPWVVTRTYGRTRPEDRIYDFLDFTCENNRSRTAEGTTTMIGPDGKPMTADAR